MRNLKVLERRLWPVVFLLLAACGSSKDSDSGLPGTPGISAFTASAPATNAGRATTLSWTVTDATSLTLQPGSIDVSAQTSIDVAPAETTTYTLIATNGAGSNEASVPVRVYDWTALGSTLDSYVADSGDNTVTGYTFIAFDRVGTLYTRSGGDQTLETIRAIASGSKLPAVAAILTLVDSGQLDLDVPVATYLALDAAFDWPRDKAAITMRMLLAHTSGFAGLDQEQPNCLSVQVLTTLRLCAQDIANTDLVAAPGAVFNYGAVDFQIAGYIATLISNQSWQDFFAKRLAAPLGLGVYSYGLGGNPRIAGGAESDIEDYSRILRMIQNDGLFDGRQVLSAAMVRELKRNQIDGLRVGFTPFPDGRGVDYPGYGLGVFITAAYKYPGSPGPEFSSPGLFGTVPWIDDGLGYGAMLIVTDTPNTGLNMWDAARPLIINQITGRAPPG